MVQKKKTFKNDEFESGFRCLPKDVPIYMNYGNHDYENGLMVIVDEIENENKDCILTTSERDIVTKESKNITLKMFQSIHFSKSTLVIMIDTTMYDTDDNESYKNCYQYAIINDGNLAGSFKNAQSKQVEFMSSVVEEIINNHSIRNIVIIGHHPIINYKIKEAKTEEAKKAKKEGKLAEEGKPVEETKSAEEKEAKKAKKAKEAKEEAKEEAKPAEEAKPKELEVLTIKLDELAKFLYEELFIKLKKTKRDFSYYYLCADLHQYQSGNITIGQGDDLMEIRQYIAGTGGANKDTYDKERIKKYIEKNLKVETHAGIVYDMSPYDIEHSRSENGFLICKENENNTLHFQFYDVNNNEIINCLGLTGGYKKHTNTKRSLKKLNKKHTKKLNKKHTKKINKKTYSN